MADFTISDEEFEQQYREGVERGKRDPLPCGTSPSDFRLYDEHGTVLEIEGGKGRWIINICQQESRSSMFITKDVVKLRRIRDALTKVLETESSTKEGKDKDSSVHE
jgi:hypothetical protein